MSKKIELLANIAVLVVAILLGTMLVQRMFFPPGPPPPPAAIAAGTKLSIPGVTWTSQKTLLIAIRPGCHFCTDSAPFYRRLIQEANGQARLLVVSGATEPEIKEYLKTLEVPLDDIKQVPLEQLGVPGTPTLILVDTKGAVVETWIGQLPPDKETEVLQKLKGSVAERRQPTGATDGVIATLLRMLVPKTAQNS